MARARKSKKFKAKTNTVVKKPKKCSYCTEKTLPSYKNPEDLTNYVSTRAKIISSRRSGVCSKHQRILTHEVKRARHLGLLAFRLKI